MADGLASLARVLPVVPGRLDGLSEAVYIRGIEHMFELMVHTVTEHRHGPTVTAGPSDCGSGPVSGASTPPCQGQSALPSTFAAPAIGGAASC